MKLAEADVKYFWYYNVSYIRVFVVRKLLLKPMKATTANNGPVVKWATQFSRLANEVAVFFFSSPLFKVMNNRDYSLYGYGLFYSSNIA